MKRMNVDKLIPIEKLTDENFTKTLTKLKKRREISYKSVRKDVELILEDIKIGGDDSVIDYTEKFDHAKLSRTTLRVSKKEIDDAYSHVTDEQVVAVKDAKRKLEIVEKKVLRRLQGTLLDKDGITVKTVTRPIQNIGCYVPGGEASYPSSLIMTVTPAKVAGAKRVVVCSPPMDDAKLNPLLLVASDICGVDEFYRVGGVQAIGAMAYGTDIIKPVQKIVGPGNVYVTEAKRIVANQISVDSPAGPTELLVICDSSANPSLIAQDIIAQSEHGTTSICGLITDSKSIAEGVSRTIASLIKKIPRRNIVSGALANAFIFVCQDISLAVKFTNSFAPEHLQIISKKQDKVSENIKNSGLVLLGKYSPVAATDYAIGTSHVLPTLGYARTTSGLSVIDYTKRVNIVECSKKGLKSLRKTINVLAEAEGLLNHSASVEARFK